MCGLTPDKKGRPTTGPGGTLIASLPIFSHACRPSEFAFTGGTRFPSTAWLAFPFPEEAIFRPRTPIPLAAPLR